MLKAVLFDMDGTLTQPVIDWGVARRRLGVPEAASIMDHIEAQEGHPRAQAEELVWVGLSSLAFVCSSRVFDAS